MRRCGFTLIEMVASLIGATVLLVALASTVVVATQLAEAPDIDQTDWRLRDLADRIEGDLRYASVLEDTSATSFRIERLHPTTETNQNAVYSINTVGVSRQADGLAAVLLDNTPSTLTIHSDRTVREVNPTFDSPATVRSVTIAATENSPAKALAIATPPQKRNGDLLILCVAVNRTNPSLPNGWTTIENVDIWFSRLVVAYRIVNGSTPNSTTITTNWNAGISAAMLLIENADSSSPIDWDSGTVGTPGYSTPSPLESSGFQDGQLNIQIFAGDEDCFPDGSIGLSGFADVARVGTLNNQNWYSNSLAIAVRNGPSPTTNSPPQCMFTKSVTWRQAGIRIEVDQ